MGSNAFSSYQTNAKYIAEKTRNADTEESQETPLLNTVFVLQCRSRLEEFCRI